MIMSCHCKSHSCITKTLCLKIVRTAQPTLQEAASFRKVCLLGAVKHCLTFEGKDIDQQGSRCCLTIHKILCTVLVE